MERGQSGGTNLFQTKSTKDGNISKQKSKSFKKSLLNVKPFGLGDVPVCIWRYKHKYHPHPPPLKPLVKKRINKALYAIIIKKNKILKTLINMC